MDRGWSSQQIAEALLISDQAVRNHIEEYKTSSNLKPDNGGSEEKLSKETQSYLNHTYEIPANTGRKRLQSKEESFDTQEVVESL